MGSNVIFDNPYLDRCLRFGWYLDIIMLLLLGDVSLMFGPIQLRIWMTGIAHLMMDDPMLSNFSIYQTFDAALGHISVLVEICRSPLICMIILSYEIHIELMICFHFVLILQWSLSWVIQSGPHFLIFRCPLASSFKRLLLMCGFISVVDLDYWDHVFDDGWFEVVWFSNLPYIWCHTGAYFPFSWDL